MNTLKYRNKCHPGRRGVLASNKADRPGSSTMLAKLANSDSIHDCQEGKSVLVFSHLY